MIHSAHLLQADIGHEGGQEVRVCRTVGGHRGLIRTPQHNGLLRLGIGLGEVCGHCLRGKQ